MDPAITPRVRAARLLSREWDAIVVGSGVGGLVCASLLADFAAMRVLVLERHYVPGGLTQTFRRGRYSWEVGVHYLGDLGPGSMPGRILAAASGGRIRWAPLPARYERVLAPGFDARFGGGREALHAQWLEHAPGEERAIDRFLDAIADCYRTAPLHFFPRMRESTGTERSPFFAWTDRTALEVIEDIGASPRLARLWTYTWPDYGAPPDRASFAALAITMQHYLAGAYYPVGGGASIARAMAAQLAAKGGALVVRAEVDEILVAGGRTTGVRLADGAEVRAPLVISDAGALATFERLVREPTELRERVRAIGPSRTHVGLYLALGAPPRELGLDGANLWVHEREVGGGWSDEAAAWVRGEREDPPALYASCGCAVDPSFAARHPRATVLSAATAVPFAPFERWAGTTRGRRGADYEAHKEALGRGMLRLLARYVPIDAIEHVEVSTPLSSAHFSGHARGEAYGLDPTPLRFRIGPRPHTPIEGLFLTGQDVWMGGICGSASGGLLTACAITQRDLARELTFRRA